MQLVRHAIDCGRAVDHRHALTLEMAKHGERKIACLAADARHYEIRFIECLAGMDCRPAPVRVNDQLEFPRPQHRKRDAPARSGFLKTQDLTCFSPAFGHVTAKDYPATKQQ